MLNEAVVLMSAVGDPDTLRDSVQAENKKAVEATLGRTPWLATAITEARQRYVTSTAQAKLAAKRKEASALPPKHSDADARHVRIAKLVEATVQKLKVEKEQQRKRAQHAKEGTEGAESWR